MEYIGLRTVYDRYLLLDLGHARVGEEICQAHQRGAWF
jgi:hypothetical protein